MTCDGGHDNCNVDIDFEFQCVQYKLLPIAVIAMTTKLSSSNGNHGISKIYKKSQLKSESCGSNLRNANICYRVRRGSLNAVADIVKHFVKSQKNSGLFPSSHLLARTASSVCQNCRPYFLPIFCTAFTPHIFNRHTYASVFTNPRIYVHQNRLKLTELELW